MNQKRNTDMTTLHDQRIAACRKKLREMGYAEPLDPMINALLAADPATGMVEWQPIETAPRDGTHIFVWLGNDEFPARWEASWRIPTESEYWVAGSDEPDPKEHTFSAEAGWFSDEGYTRKLDGDAYPTAWLPIPLPPAPEKDA